MYTQPVKTTIDIDQDILYRVKLKALEQNRTLRALVNEALLNLIEKTAQQKKPNLIKIGGHDLGGIKGNLNRQEIYEDF